MERMTSADAEALAVVQACRSPREAEGAFSSILKHRMHLDTGGMVSERILTCRVRKMPKDADDAQRINTLNAKTSPMAEPALYTQAGVLALIDAYHAVGGRRFPKPLKLS